MEVHKIEFVGDRIYIKSHVKNDFTSPENEFALLFPQFSESKKKKKKKK